jgi:hypothetical protein
MPMITDMPDAPVYLYLKSKVRSARESALGSRSALRMPNLGVSAPLRWLPNALTN